MSQLLRVLNAFKRSIADATLTAHQTQCRVWSMDRLAYPGIINLYGKHGVGKTVLGWRLVAEGHATYAVEPSHITDAANPAVILFVDNAGHRRGEFRYILGELERARVSRAVIATRERVEDTVTSREMACTEEDIQIACKNMARLGFPATDQPATQLWEVLQNACGLNDNQY
jgi:hypothetical protein